MTLQRLLLCCKHCAKAGTSLLDPSHQWHALLCAAKLLESHRRQGNVPPGITDKNQGLCGQHFTKHTCFHEQQINASQPHTSREILLHASCHRAMRAAWASCSRATIGGTTMLGDSCHSTALDCASGTCCSH